jgi:hypothetical protein
MSVHLFPLRISCLPCPGRLSLSPEVRIGCRSRREGGPETQDASSPQPRASGTFRLGGVFSGDHKDYLHCGTAARDKSVDKGDV